MLLATPQCSPASAADQLRCFENTLTSQSIAGIVEPEELLQIREVVHAVGTFEREGVPTDAAVKQLGERIWRRQFCDVKSFAQLATDGAQRLRKKYVDLGGQVGVIADKIEERCQEAEAEISRCTRLRLDATSRCERWIEWFRLAAVVAAVVAIVTTAVAGSLFFLFKWDLQHQRTALELAEQAADSAAQAKSSHEKLNAFGGRILLGAAHLQILKRFDDGRSRGLLKLSCRSASRAHDRPWKQVERQKARKPAWQALQAALAYFFVGPRLEQLLMSNQIIVRRVSSSVNHRNSAHAALVHATKTSVTRTEIRQQRSQGAAMSSLAVLLFTGLLSHWWIVLRQFLESLWAQDIKAHVEQCAEMEARKQQLDSDLSKVKDFARFVNGMKDLITSMHDVAQLLGQSAGNASLLDNRLVPTDASDTERAVTGEALRKEVIQLHKLHRALASSRQSLCNAFRFGGEELWSSASQKGKDETENDPALSEMGGPAAAAAAVSVTSHEGVSQIATEPAGYRHQCVLDDAYLVIPVTAVAKIGGITACGPSGCRFVSVAPQGERERLVTTITVGERVQHTFTSDHRLLVQRNGVWFDEEVSQIEVGDVVTVGDGTAVVREPVRTLHGLGNVFELHIQGLPGERSPAEVFVQKANRRSDGSLGLSTLAVLGASTEEKEAPTGKRAPSAPPSITELRMRDLPSIGSARHPTDGTRCTFACRKFERFGSCAKGFDCEFCHFEHPENFGARRALRGRLHRAEAGGAGTASQTEQRHAGEDAA